jgi:hypothetical protein
MGLDQTDRCQGLATECSDDRRPQRLYLKTEVVGAPTKLWGRHGASAFTFCRKAKDRVGDLALGDGEPEDITEQLVHKRSGWVGVWLHSEIALAGIHRVVAVWGLTHEEHRAHRGLETTEQRSGTGVQERLGQRGAALTRLEAFDQR